MPVDPGWRWPYVGSGADGARRSAIIDRDELDTLDRDDPRREAILDSIARWERQAEEEERKRPRPDYDPRVDYPERFTEGPI